MEHLPKKIHHNGIGYTLMGDYYIPDLKLPEEKRPIGRWGRMHKAFLQEHCPGQYNELLLSGKLWTYLADLNEQADDRLACIISQMQDAEGVTEELKACARKTKATSNTAFRRGYLSKRKPMSKWRREKKSSIPIVAVLILSTATLLP